MVLFGLEKALTELPATFNPVNDESTILLVAFVGVMVLATSPRIWPAVIKPDRISMFCTNATVSIVALVLDRLLVIDVWALPDFTNEPSDILATASWTPVANG